MTEVAERRRAAADGTPWLSLCERDRRWDVARKFMQDHGMVALIVAGIRGRERYDTYFSGEAYEGVVVIPLDSEPVYFVTQAHRITLRYEAANAGIRPWIADARPGVRMFEGVAELINQRGLAGNAIGVIGLYSRGPMEMEGLITSDAWDGLREATRSTEFIDVSQEYSLFMLPKSAEEQDVARAAAAIGEEACAAMLDAATIGATDAEIYGAIVATIFRRGAYTAHPHLLLRSGPDTVGWGPPNTFTSGARPRSIRDGDVILAEIFTCLAGIETQQEMTITIGSAAERFERPARASRASYDAAIAALRPGMTFTELCGVMEKPIADEGLWHLGPNVHTISPLTMVDAAFMGVELLPEPLVEGMNLHSVPPNGDGVIGANTMLVLEPNATDHKARALLGGTIIVHEERIEELNSLPCSIHHVDTASRKG